MEQNEIKSEDYNGVKESVWGLIDCCLRTNNVIENVKQDGEVKKKGLKTQRKERHQRALRADSKRDKMIIRENAEKNTALDIQKRIYERERNTRDISKSNSNQKM